MRVLQRRISNRAAYILTNADGLSRKMAFNIINTNPFNNFETEEDFVSAIMSYSFVDKEINLTKDEILECYYNASIAFENLMNEHIAIISFFDKEYPIRLRYIPSPPLLLYVQGNVKVLNSKKIVSIVGTRYPSDYGLRAGYKLSKVLNSEGCTIVSGLTAGCDIVSHKGCIDRNGKTIAVLAYGFNNIYPKRNLELSNKIIENGGAIISEYDSNTAPQPSYYIECERILSGLSDAVAVVETGVQGQAVRTVNIARKQKRIISCLLHPEQHRHHAKYRGNIKLLNKQAIPIYDRSDISRLLRKIEIKSEDFLISYNNSFQNNLPEVC